MTLYCWICNKDMLHYCTDSYLQPLTSVQAVSITLLLHTTFLVASATFAYTLSCHYVLKHLTLKWCVKALSVLTNNKMYSNVVNI